MGGPQATSGLPAPLEVDCDDAAALRCCDVRVDELELSIVGEERARAGVERELQLSLDGVDERAVLADSSREETGADGLSTAHCFASGVRLEVPTDGSARALELKALVDGECVAVGSVDVHEVLRAPDDERSNFRRLQLGLLATVGGDPEPAALLRCRLTLARRAHLTVVEARLVSTVESKTRYAVACFVDDALLGITRLRATSSRDGALRWYDRFDIALPNSASSSSSGGSVSGSKSTAGRVELRLFDERSCADAARAAPLAAALVADSADALSLAGVRQATLTTRASDSAARHKSVVVGEIEFHLGLSELNPPHRRFYNDTSTSKAAPHASLASPRVLSCRPSPRFQN